MDQINVAQLDYQLVATLSDGSGLDLTHAVTALEWGDQNGEIAQRASIELARIPLQDGTMINEALPLCTQVSILANGTECFRGVIWDWEFESSDSSQITLTAYDRFIYQQKSKECFYWKKGAKTEKVIKEICEKCGITLEYDWGSHTHEKIQYRAQTIAECILNTLEDARVELNKRYVAIYVGNTLKIHEPGQNEEMYYFSSEGGNTLAVSHKISLDELVTRVKVVAKGTKAKVKASMDGKTEFGIIQDIVDMSGMKLKKAKHKAELVLQEKGKPKETIQIDAPDVPTIRKGDAVYVRAGSLDGRYIVLAVTHTADSRSMSMELEIPLGEDGGDD